MTQRGKETSLQLPSGQGQSRRSLPGQPRAHGCAVRGRAVRMQPAARAPKSAVSQRGTQQPRESPRRPPGLTSLPGLPAPLPAAFPRRLSICMKRKSNACLGLDRTAELRAI